jgi:hypothetical protein
VPKDPRVDPPSDPSFEPVAPEGRPRFPALPPDATPADHLRRSQDIAAAYASTAYRLERAFECVLPALTREVSDLRSELQFHVGAIANRTAAAKTKAKAELLGRDAAIGMRLDELEHHSVAPPPMARPPTSPRAWAPALPPMRARTDSSLELAHHLGEMAGDEFTRDSADHSTPPPDGARVAALVTEGVAIAIARLKAAQWDRLEAERKAAEDERVAAAKEAEALRLELLAQNGRERVRVKWVAVAGAASTFLTLVGLLGALLLRPGAPPGARPPPAATVDPDGGARAR